MEREWNRRKNPRLKHPCLVKVSYGEEQKEEFLTYVNDIGTGGACFICYKALNEQSVVDLELDITDLGVKINCKARVVRAVEYEDVQDCSSFYKISVEFIDLKEDDSVRILNLVRFSGKIADNLI